MLSASPLLQLFGSERSRMVLPIVVVFVLLVARLPEIVARVVVPIPFCLVAVFTIQFNHSDWLDHSYAGILIIHVYVILSLPGWSLPKVLLSDWYTYMLETWH